MSLFRTVSEIFSIK